MFKSLYIPGLGWSVDVHTRYPADGPCWGHARGRCREHVWWMPLGPWTLTFNGCGQSYAKLVGFNLPIGWILDEFDASFDSLAIASLRYHLGYSCANNEAYREEWEALIARLSERHARFTEDEMAVIHPSGARFRLDGAERHAAFAAYREREDAREARIQQARHDFIDTLPKLWS